MHKPHRQLESEKGTQIYNKQEQRAGSNIIIACGWTYIIELNVYYGRELVCIINYKMFIYDN